MPVTRFVPRTGPVAEEQLPLSYFRRDSSLTPEPCLVGRKPRPAAETRYRYPGYELVRTIARDEAARTGFLNEREAIVLLEFGVKGLARDTARSARTIRRRLLSASCTPRELARRLRIRITAAGISASVPLSVLATWLGFSSPDSYRRFLRRECGVKIKELRRRVRSGTGFPREPC